MSGSDWLVGIAGGLSGINEERVRQDNRRFERQKLAQQGEIQRLRDEIRLMIAEMNEGGRAVRHTTPSANVELQQSGATTRATNRNDVTRRGQDLTYDLGVRRDDTTRRGQDFSQINFGKTNHRLWEGLRLGDQCAQERNWLTERGQDMTFDLGGRRLEGDAGSRALGYAIRAYENEIRRREWDESALEPAPSFDDWLDTSGDPEIFPNVRRMFSGRRHAEPPTPAARRLACDAAAATAWCADACAVSLRGPSGAARGATALDRRRQAISGGQTVRLRNGQTVTIKKINPDGTFEY